MDVSIAITSLCLLASISGATPANTTPEVRNVDIQSFIPGVFLSVDTLKGLQARAQLQDSTKDEHAGEHSKLDPDISLKTSTGLSSYPSYVTRYSSNEQQPQNFAPRNQIPNYNQDNLNYRSVLNNRPFDYNAGLIRPNYNGQLNQDLLAVDPLTQANLLNLGQSYISLSPLAQQSVVPFAQPSYIANPNLQPGLIPTAPTLLTNPGQFLVNNGQPTLFSNPALLAAKPLITPVPQSPIYAVLPYHNGQLLPNQGLINGNAVLLPYQQVPTAPIY